jgi:hypothetical protein
MKEDQRVRGHKDMANDKIEAVIPFPKSRHETGLGRVRGQDKTGAVSHVRGVRLTLEF